MKTSLRKSKYLAALVIASQGFLLSPSVFGTTYTWDADANSGNGVTAGSGTWDAASTNWYNGTSDVAWAGGTNNAVFASTAGAYTITMAGTLNFGSLTFNTTGYTLAASSASVLSTTAGSPVVQVVAGGTATIGSNVSVQGVGSLTLVGSGAIGSGTGTLVIDNGGSVKTTTASAVLYIGYNFISLNSTKVQVNTGGLLSSGQAIAVDGLLEVDGGTVSSAANSLIAIGNQAITNMPTAAILTINSGSVTTGVVGLRFGTSAGAASSGGILNLNGGTLTTTKIFSAGSSSSSTVNFNGGTLVAAATNNSDFLAAASSSGGINNAIVQAGGAIVDTNGYNVTISKALTHDSTLGSNVDGGLTKKGTGMLTLSAGNTYTGITWIYGGGSLAVGVNNALPTTTTLILGGTDNSIGTFDLNGNNQTIAGLSGTGTGTKTVTNNGASTSTLTITGGGTYSGVITNGSGTTALTVSGGNLALGGANTFTGATTISSGTLQLGNSGTTGSLATTSTIVNNSVFAINRSNAVAQGTDFSAAAISGTGQFTQAGTGNTTLSAANTFSGAVNVQNGEVSFSTVAANGSAQALGSGSTVNLGVANTSSGILNYTGAAGTLAKNIYALGNGLNTVQNRGSGLLTLSGSLVKNGTILVLNGGSSGITVTGTISGSSNNSDLYVTEGTTTLSAANTYNGSTWVYGGGTLINGVTNALPTNTTLVLGGTNGGTDNSSNTFDLHGYNQSITALSSTGSGTQTVTNNGTGTSTLTISGGGTYGGVISNGSGITALALTGGNLLLGGSNTYTGATAVTGGTLTLNGSLAAGSAVSVNGATLAGSGTANGTVTGTNAIINGSNLTLGATELYGASTLAGITTATSITDNSGTLTVSGTTTSDVTVKSGATLAGSGQVIGTVSGNSATINGRGLSIGVTTLSGSSTLSGYNIASSVTVKSGTTSLTGTTRSTGTLLVSAGATLNANGTIAGSASVSGVLKGNSTVTGNLTLTSGTLSPGNSSGITTVEGNFTVDHNSTLVAQVSGTVAGISYDQVKVSGNVSLDGTLDLSTLTGLTLGSTITLVDNTGNGTTTGYFSTILTSDSSYTVTSNSDYTFTSGTTEYLLSFSANSDGGASFNDVTLTVVPEPSTWAILVGGIGMLAFVQSLRRRSPSSK